MMRNNKLSKSISDSSWAKFIHMLEYKAESAGGQVIKVNPNGTTQECSNCKSIIHKKLSDRKHECSCGLKVNKDYNSAINILNKINRSTLGNKGSNAWGDVSIETPTIQETKLI